MSWIIETPNPFEPFNGLKKHEHKGGGTIRQWLERTYPGFKEFDKPTIILVNGDPILRKEWDEYHIKKDDIINIVAVVGEVITIIIIVVVVALAVALALTMAAPATPGEGPASDPVYTTKGQTNAIRLGEPIEVNYGRNRIYPSLASRPFFQYIGNDQFQHSLFCIGQGSYEIEQILIGDTDINDFQEVEYNILEPGATPDIFATNVFTSAEAGGQTLFAPNEAEYVSPGFVGPFPASQAGSQSIRIEVDLVYPKGIYRQKKSGGLAQLSITVVFEKREIDDLGNPLSGWTTLFTHTQSGRTTTPQRITVGTDVATARYEVRGRRTDIKNLKPSAGHDVVWEGLRSRLEGVEPDFGDVTLLEVKIRATNNLNARTQERFNVIATRKIPVIESAGVFDESEGAFTELTVSRSIVWAFVDVFRSHYGGQIGEDFFDWDTLIELDAFYESRNEHFDWTFRDAITVWEAATAIARAGRAVPLLVGSRITMKRDGPLTVPVTMFNPTNMIKGTFQWDIKLWEPNEHDSIQVEYTEPDTGYKQEQVLCTLPGDTQDNPRDVRLPGVQDRNHAYHEGLYMLAVERYIRENFTFETGMEGFIPSFGDLVALSHDVPRWSQSGYIIGVTELSDGRFELHLSEPVDFGDSGDYVILLRDKHANVLGPSFVEQTSDSTRVIVDITSSEQEQIDFLLTGKTEPMLFIFGVNGQEAKYAKIVKIEPLGGERIKITCVPEVSTIHSFDELEAPALESPSLPPEIPDLPTIPELVLTRVEGPLLIVQASWRAAFGAQYYIVQTSEDGTNWRLRGITERTSMLLDVNPGIVYVRVAAVNNGQGPWITESISVGIVTGITELIPWEFLEWKVTWWDSPNVDLYETKVYNNLGTGAVFLGRIEYITPPDDPREFLYNWTKAVTDTDTNMEIGDAGFTGVNGTLSEIGTRNGKNAYGNGTAALSGGSGWTGTGTVCYWTGTQWYIGIVTAGVITNYYVSNIDMTYPWEPQDWAAGVPADDPAPLVMQFALVREHLFQIDTHSLNDEGVIEADGLPQNYPLSNTIPLSPSNSSIGYEFVGLNTEGTHAVYRIFWTNPDEDDLWRAVVWLSSIDGFDPVTTNPVFDDHATTPGPANVAEQAFVEIELDSSGDHAEHYFRVGVFDVWGNEIQVLNSENDEGNVSDQETIQGYSNWLLDGGFWDDGGEWDDGEFWED